MTDAAGRPASGTITHRDILRGLTTLQKRHLTMRSNAMGLRQLALHLGLIVVLVAANASSDGMIRLAAMTAQGIAMVFLFTAMHECSHGTAFRSGWINRLVGGAAGFLLLQGPGWFFYFHQDHHKFTQDPQRDPELLSPKPRGFGGYLVYLSGIPVWMSALRILFVTAAGRLKAGYVPVAARTRLVREARLMLAGYAIVLPLLALQGWLVWFVLLPLLLGQPFLRAFLLAEHAGCTHGSDNMLANSRSLLTHPVVRFLSWNMPFHTEHHSFTAVPFHRLPALHAIMADKLIHKHCGYAAFHRLYVGQLTRPTKAPPAE